MRYVALLLCLLIAQTISVQASADEPSFEIDDCPFALPEGETEGDTIVCGYLIVPETRSQPDSDLIALAVAILFSPAAEPAPDPLIYLAGGPGVSALLEADIWAQSPLRAQRDILLIDQRGVGYSLPALECDAFYKADDPERACYEYLVREGIDLAAYNSAASAADIADLLRVLELDEANLYGVSYGTRLALTIMRSHADRVRSVILDSAYPPHISGLDEQPLYGAAAIRRLFGQCALDAACRSFYGDLETTFYQLVDRWNEDPVIVSDPASGDEVEMTGDDLVNGLYEALYISEAIPALPYGIYLLDQGDTVYGPEVLFGWYTRAELDLLAAGGALPEDEWTDRDDQDGPDGDSEGMYHSVECREEVPFASIEAVRALAETVPPQLYEALLVGVEDQMAVCAFWDSGPLQASDRSPVTSDIPTLVLAGAFDPITPSAWGRAAAGHLPNSLYIEFPYAGHSVLDSGECAHHIAADFLADPSAPPETDCVTRTRLEFFIPPVCMVTPLNDVRTYAGPATDYRRAGQLDPDLTYTAGAYSDDGKYYWLHLRDEGWVREDEVDFPDGCLMLPYVEE